MIKVSVKMNLSFPELNTSKPLKDIADQVIVVDIGTRMDQGIGVDDSPHRKNVNSTTEKKAKKGLRTSPPLIASGQLRKSFVVTAGDNVVTIAPRGYRRAYPGDKAGRMLNNNELADILQNQGVRHGGNKYNFFGISRKAEQEAMKFMSDYVKKEIADGRRKFVR